MKAQIVRGDRSGLVERVELDRPRVRPVPSCVSYSAWASSHPQHAPWTVDTVTGGAALADHEAARRAAIGEAVERYCANVVPPRLPTGSFTALRRAGADAVDPREFALYSAAQYAHRGFPFVALTPGLEIAWAPGRTLDGDDEILVPASLVYVNYFRGERAAEPPTNYPLLAGTAAGTSALEATLPALEELLERDAVTLWWLSGAPATAPAFEPDANGPLATALTEAERAGLRVSLLRIPSTFEVQVAGVFVEDPARRLVAFGSACRPAPEAATAKAFTEALGMHEAGLDLLDAGGPFWTAVRAGKITGRPYRAHRSDRAYLDGFRPDLRDVNDVRLHLQLYLDPRAQDGRLARLRHPRPAHPAPAHPAPAHPGSARAEPAAVPAGPHQRLGRYLSLLDDQGLRAVVVDLTTREAAEAGLSVVRVIVPGLYSNAPAAFPFLGGERLYREPPARGWTPGPLTEDGLVRDPLPFS
ncbi:YcaO-like family protein [Actinomadura sp. KC216]|uniref:YcaO-like family protein n=1 Tax=Actinomadura sp. KC216 TaxID=2530370 RepID=UPI0014047E07|nr:YcaO-like family protein [Actinomadura sp. KC216]